MPRITNNRNDPKAHLAAAIFGGGDMGLGSSMPQTGEGPDTYLNRIDARDAARAVGAGTQARIPTNQLSTINAAGHASFAVGAARKAGLMLPEGPSSMVPKRLDWPPRGQYPGPASDHPDFKGTGPGAPIHNEAGEHIGNKVQHYVDPEKHIQNTSGAPWSLGSTDVWTGPPALSSVERGGRTPGKLMGKAGQRRSTASTWFSKVPEATESATAEHRLIPGQIVKNPTHGSGIANSLYGGGHIRNPINVIQDEAEFGHPYGVQWEGHHRVIGAALEQQRRRREGRSDWSVPVPVDYITGDEATELKAKAKANEDAGVKEPDRFPVPEVKGLDLLHKRQAITGGLEQGPSSRHSPEIASVMTGRPYDRPITPLTEKQSKRKKAEKASAKVQAARADLHAITSEHAEKRQKRERREELLAKYGPGR
jgi:hypothetical protein